VSHESDPLYVVSGTLEPRPRSTVQVEEGTLRPERASVKRAFRVLVMAQKKETADPSKVA